MPPATLQKSEPEASQLACIGEPFTNSSYKRADHLLFITRSFAGRNENIQQYSIIAAQRELLVDSCPWVDKMSTDRQSGMNVAHLVLAINHPSL